ncbi:M24 family metallopeptidase [Bradyrhizobium sp. CSA207]|uniref:M24 family metallopeptidase n=1 Tax=Bradyrhizobium sp. CSA207 TaxID=2698826 RepID=UPI0023AEB632|nr:Xaa-Pro peptidase family protein [Bradyrhizobium sp. CSA207]MDE5446996.1 M24 family metallopeptidase [Bradyrhizobium sp. CSA207]
MTTDIPFTGVPFPRSEYERRQENALAAVQRAGLDALLVTAHGHLRYLTGYHGYGAYFAPFPLILTPGRAPTFVVREFEVEGVRAESCIDEMVAYTEQYDFATVCADILRRYGLQGRRVGFELGCWNLAPNDLSALQVRLPDMKVVDATRLVASVAAVKSELELKTIRDAIAITDLAVRTFQNSLREGITEVEMSTILDAEVKKAGGELRPARTIVFGERTKLSHGSPMPHAMAKDQPAMIELGGWKYGYAVGLVRGAVLGDHSDAESLHDLSVEALEATIAAIKPGVTAGEVDAAGRNVIVRSGRQVLRHRVGYQTGIHWTERGNISLEPGAADIIEAGMTLHMPLILSGESGHLFGTSEHVLVTERGVEILSRTPHKLYRA